MLAAILVYKPRHAKGSERAVISRMRIPLRASFYSSGWKRHEKMVEKESSSGPGLRRRRK